MSIFFILIIVGITYEFYRIFPKYLKLKYKGVLCEAKVVELVNTIGSFGIVPKVNYTVDSKSYSFILPIHSSFVAKNNYYVGSKVQVYVNSKKPSECVIKSDSLIMLQLLITIIVYSVSIYYWLFGFN